MIEPLGHRVSATAFCPDPPRSCPVGTAVNLHLAPKKNKMRLCLRGCCCVLCSTALVFGVCVVAELRAAVCAVFCCVAFGGHCVRCVVWCFRDRWPAWRRCSRTTQTVCLSRATVIRRLGCCRRLIARELALHRSVQRRRAVWLRRVVRAIVLSVVRWPARLCCAAPG